MTDYLFEHYNKFNEDKRLKSRHGMVEYINTVRRVREYIELKGENIRIFDIGAGTGAYCGPLSEEGFEVFAVELIQHNLGRLKQKYPKVNAHKGNALNLKKFKDESFDITLLFGPMYHLFGNADKQKALMEAKRVTKKGGIIFVAYLTNEYALITRGFKEHHILDAIKEGKVTSSFVVNNSEEDIYDYITLDDINNLNEKCGLVREKIFSPDGPADYMREQLKEMSEEEFSVFVDYQYKAGERYDLLGAGAHLVDVLKRVD